MIRSTSLPILTIVLTVHVAAAQTTPPDAREVREAVEKSLPFLDRASSAWMHKKRECAGCHHALVLWSFNEARAHGLAVDDGKLDELTNWWLTYCKGYLSGPPGSWGFRPGLQKNKPDDLPPNVLAVIKTFWSQWYPRQEDFVAALKQAMPPEDWERYQAKILARADRATATSWRARSQQQLASRNVPEPVLASMKSLIDKIYFSQEPFLDDLKKALPAAALQRYQADILDVAEAPVEADSIAFMLLGADVARSKDRAALAKLIEPVCQQQRQKGYWNPGGQYPNQNRPWQESAQACTMWMVLAMSAIADAPAPEAIAASRQRAVQWLQDAKPGDSTESLFLNMLLARQLGQTERADALLKLLLEEQKPDGGWSWRRDCNRSDAMTTGQVLWVLSIVGGNPDAVARGRRYLVDTQNLREPGPPIKDGDLPYWQFLSQPAEGSWLMSCKGISKIKTRTGVCDAMYQCWGTSWAVIGLLRTQPK